MVADGADVAADAADDADAADNAADAAVGALAYFSLSLPRVRVPRPTGGETAACTTSASSAAETKAASRSVRRRTAEEAAGPFLEMTTNAATTTETTTSAATTDRKVLADFLASATGLIPLGSSSLDHPPHIFGGQEIRIPHSRMPAYPPGIPELIIARVNRRNVTTYRQTECVTPRDPCPWKAGTCSSPSTLKTAFCACFTTDRSSSS
jgi:hypothetical protein